MRYVILLLFLAVVSAARADADAWKGPYIGVNVGGARASSSWITDATTGPPATETVEHSANGGMFGLQLGYRLAASDHFLLGLEAQLHAAELKASSPSSLAAAPNRERITRIRSPLSAVVVAGIAGARSLAYVRGGYAYAAVELEAINHNIGNIALWEGHATGWTAGAGFEYRIRRRLSVGIEYDYSKLSAVNMGTVNNGGAFVVANEFQTRIHMLMARANYRF